MKKLFQKYTLQSEKNGPITVVRFLKWSTVYAGGFDQSSAYLVKLWGRGIAEVPKNTPVQTVCMLGLGGGCALRVIEKRFPEARVTVIEWDPVMVRIAKDLHQFRKEPEILIGDVCDVLPNLHRQFDLVLGDAFFGDKPESRIAEREVGNALRNLLAPQGKFIINISRTPALLDALQEFLHLEKTIQFRINTVGVFTSLSSGGHGGNRTRA